MFRKKRQKEEFDKKVNNIYKRIRKERLEQPRSTVLARMMPSNVESGKINVKIIMKITDDSFLCRQVKLWFSSGVQEFKPVTMDKTGDKSFEVILANLPIDTTVLYYFELLDKGGVWLKRLKDEQKQEAFEFSTSRDGISEKKDWDNNELIKCTVCEYMCQPEWDTCPVCGQGLHDEMLRQDIFIDEQEAKEQKREAVKEEAIWKNAGGDFEELPECPSCNYSVRLSWQTCPICNHDLSELKEELQKNAKTSKKLQKNKNYDIL